VLNQLKKLTRRPVIFGLAAVLAAALCIPTLLREQPAQAAAAITNWGLSFQQPGKTPTGNASAEYLSDFDAYFVAPEEQNGEKAIYLTFDCGYENGCTAPILDALKKHNVKACFFVVGNYLDSAPELVQRMTEEGHIVGNHTLTHPDMSEIADLGSFQQQLEGVEEKYRQITGQEMQKFYRPPQGKFSESNLQQAQQLGYKTIFWSLAYVDWYADKQPSHEEAFEKLCGRIHPGAIVLLHSTSQTNAEILDELLTKWEGEGYTFKTLDQLGQ
jgi:peptidoglycan-N-acetylmuramic acid deacetylase